MPSRCTKCRKKQPSYGLPGEKAVLCADCKEEGMVNVNSKKCTKCRTKRPSYGLPGEKAVRCANCKEEGMVNVVSKKCEKCRQKIPTFALPGEQAVRCADCKEAGMVDVVNKKCEKCRKKCPTFALPGEQAVRCANCKEAGMVNVKDKMCEKCRQKIPFYGLPGEQAVRCAACKEAGMVNVNDKMCVKCRQKIPTFALPGEQAVRCAACKEEGMVDVVNKMCEKCRKKQPNYGLPGEQAVRCAACKEEGMVNVVAKMCRHNEACREHPKGTCFSLGNPKYRGYCTHCFAHLFPTDPLTFQIRCKTKEIRVRDFLNARFPDLGFIHDRPLFTGGCDCTHRRRIDHRALIGGTLLCVETDEHQHRSYCPQDEASRYDDLFMVHSGRWVFVRFNPDKYVDDRGKKRNPELADRLRRLAAVVEDRVAKIRADEPSDASDRPLVEIVHLFYDHGVGNGS